MLNNFYLSASKWFAKRASSTLDVEFDMHDTIDDQHKNYEQT